MKLRGNLFVPERSSEFPPKYFREWKLARHLSNDLIGVKLCTNNLIVSRQLNGAYDCHVGKSCVYVCLGYFFICRPAHLGRLSEYI